MRARQGGWLVALIIAAAAGGAQISPRPTTDVASVGSGGVVPTSMRGLRGGGGQKKWVKRKKDERKQALRQQYDNAERWKECKLPTARHCSTPVGMAHEDTSPQVHGLTKNTLGTSTDRSESARELSSQGGSPIESEANPASDELDVMLLDSDEICVGPDGEDLMDEAEEETRAGGGKREEWALRVEKDDSKLCLTHPEPVFSVAVSPFVDNMVATGGGDDYVYLWDVGGVGGQEAGQPPSLTHGLQSAACQDSVVALSFSHDGTYLAAAAMDGYVRVWIADSGALATVLEGSGALIWMQWHPRGHVILAGSDDGCTYMWEIAHTCSPQGAEVFHGTCLQVFAGHTEAVTCGGFAATGKLVVTGTAQADIRVYSPKDGSLLHCLHDEVNLHRAAITTLACHQTEPVVVCGDQDGRVSVIQVETGKLKLVLPLPPACGHTASVESIAIARQVLLGAQRELVVTGSLDGSARVWDVSTGIERCRVELSLQPGRVEGVTKVLWAAHAPMFVAGGVFGSIMACSGIDGARLRSFSAHAFAIHDMALSRDARFLLSASDDATARVFVLS